MIKITSNRFHRRAKNKFIHAPDNPWTKCIVTKLDNSLIYQRKATSEKEKLVEIISGNSNERLSISNNLHLKFGGKVIGYIPKLLISIYEEIEKSKYILELKENWNDDGGVGYDFEVWKKAILFISKLSTRIYKSYGQIIRAPKIYHGPNGSIDVFWENESFNLLINIPKNGLGTFYGDNYGNNKSEGFFDPTIINSTIFPFLIEF